MWKNKTSKKISQILSRRILLSKSPSSSSSSSLFIHSNTLLSTSFPSQLPSRFVGRIEPNMFPSSKDSILGNKFSLSSPKNVNLFCSQSKSTEKFNFCWNCGEEASNATTFLVCQACRSVQPVEESIDYFQIFRLGRNCKIDGGELERKYKDWQKKLHPDLVHSKSKREREYAAEQSARVIDAYRTLADPLSRAIYIVKLEGVVMDEEERITDLELLDEIMELRESVEEAEDLQALNQIQAQLHEKFEHWSNSFEDAYLSKKFEDALAAIRRMIYYKRANEEIIKKL